MSKIAMVLLSLVLLASAPMVHAQTHRASVRGTVSDPNQALIPRATIKLTNRGTNETRSVISGDDGEYTLTTLPPGLFRLEVAAPGFATFVQDIVLNVNQELRVDPSLALAGVATDGDLIVPPPSELKKDAASIGTVIENRQVEGLPLDGRNFYELGLLVPGAVPAAPGSAGSVRGDFSFSGWLAPKITAHLSIFTLYVVRA